MKTYRGYRAGGGCAVEVHCEPSPAQGRRPRAACGADDVDAGMTYFLPSRLDLVHHSPTGFEWGYNGSGPAQLALALLADALGEDLALKCYQDFKSAVIAILMTTCAAICNGRKATAAWRCQGNPHCVGHTPHARMWNGPVMSWVAKNSP